MEGIEARDFTNCIEDKNLKEAISKIQNKWKLIKRIDGCIIGEYKKKYYVLHKTHGYCGEYVKYEQALDTAQREEREIKIIAKSETEIEISNSQFFVDIFGTFNRLSLVYPATAIVYIVVTALLL